MDRLRGIDLSGVEPLTSVGGGVNRLDDDVPGPVLTNEALLKMAPDTMAPFVKVPKVIDDGGGA
jgi:aspartyl/glutamyl-tRNA(Asn/Gln) amidotransferase C subunit